MGEIAYLSQRKIKIMVSRKLPINFIYFIFITTRIRYFSFAQWKKKNETKEEMKSKRVGPPNASPNDMRKKMVAGQYLYSNNGKRV